MAVVEKHEAGTFCWAELLTPDQGAAKAFYSALFGWQTVDYPMGGDEVYTMMKIGDLDVCAVYAPPPAMGIPPHWGLYIATTSVDDTVAAAVKVGATVVSPAMNVATYGRMAILQDPTGAIFKLWEAKTHIGFRRVGEVGAVCWGELATRDTAKAGEFYSSIFGWGRQDINPGDMAYTVWLNNGKGFGGMMAMTPQMGDAPASWVTYFMVANCDETAALANKLGGRICHPPQDIPNTGRFSVIQDPQGAVFAIIQVEAM